MKNACTTYHSYASDGRVDDDHTDVWRVAEVGSRAESKFDCKTFPRDWLVIVKETAYKQLGCNINFFFA